MSFFVHYFGFRKVAFLQPCNTHLFYNRTHPPTYHFPLHLMVKIQNKYKTEWNMRMPIDAAWMADQNISENFKVYWCARNRSLITRCVRTKQQKKSRWMGFFL